jgi:hypothetical protein
MKRKPYPRRKRTTTKSVLRLPDLEHAKAAVLNSLTSLDAQRGYASGGKSEQMRERTGKCRMSWTYITGVGPQQEKHLVTAHAALIASSIALRSGDGPLGSNPHA